MTIKELERCYARFNKKYFDGKLPATVPIVLTDMSKSGDDGLCTTYHGQGMAPQHTIYLDSTLKDRDVELKRLLLHEMVHAKLYPSGSHDDGKEEREFDEAMLILAFRGAFHGLW